MFEDNGDQRLCLSGIVITSSKSSANHGFMVGTHQQVFYSSCLLFVTTFRKKTEECVKQTGISTTDTAKEVVVVKFISGTC